MIVLDVSAQMHFSDDAILPNFAALPINSITPRALLLQISTTRQRQSWNQHHLQ